MTTQSSVELEDELFIEHIAPEGYCFDTVGGLVQQFISSENTIIAIAHHILGYLVYDLFDSYTEEEKLWMLQQSNRDDVHNAYNAQLQKFQI
jgi:hypothetical protein